MQELPLTETTFFILTSLASGPRHGYAIMKDVQALSEQRILLSTGKICHELRRERSRLGRQTAVISHEQLYPFPEKELIEALGRHTEAREIVWVQEEPANMGALFFVEPRIRRLAGGRTFRSVKRSATATPATGSARAHQVEQNTLITLAFARVR